MNEIVTGTATIVVVEDQDLVRTYITNVLEESGYRVISACDGNEALGILASEPVNLILTDIAMPHMNGYQLFEEVRANPNWLAIPIIFLTAREMDSDVRYGKALGVDDYLTKPVRPDDLRAAVQGKLRRAAQISQLIQQREDCPTPAVDEPTNILSVGALKMDTNQHRIWRQDTLVDLSAREFALLQYLMENAKTVVSHEELVTVTHGINTDRNDAASLLRPLIRTLRRKLGYDVGDSGCIENIRSVGYRLIPPQT